MTFAPAELFADIQQFLNWEAALLDQRRFDEWLELFTSDVHYWMPVVGGRVATETELAWFDDDKASLALRIQRLSTKEAHAETPPSRTRRLIGTVLLDLNDDGIHVNSNFLIYRTRRERDMDLFAGLREDVLRRENGAWRIARRKIMLDQDILANQTLSIFF
jgi:3-phenylpropionate/cinnamic acid dioxygenase small subunit